MAEFDRKDDSATPVDAGSWERPSWARPVQLASPGELMAQARPPTNQAPGAPGPQGPANRVPVRRPPPGQLAGGAPIPAPPQTTVPEPRADDPPNQLPPLVAAGKEGRHMPMTTLNTLRARQDAGQVLWDVHAPENADDPAARHHDMAYSAEGIAELKGGEGSAPNPYQDNMGFWTIGHGHLIDKNTNGRIEAAEWAAYDALGFPRSGLTEEQQVELFNVDAVNAALTRPVTQAMFDALVSMTFNHGSGFPTGGGKAIFQAINAGEYDQLPALFMRHVYSKGKVLKGLKNRRLKELSTFATPYPKAAKK
jgi:GH24 family phage-related lysozyme (muramidase)